MPRSPSFVARCSCPPGVAGRADLDVSRDQPGQLEGGGIGLRANLDLAKFILSQVVPLLGMARGLLRTAEDVSQTAESNPDLMK
jgi:hypothetical protein